MNNEEAEELAWRALVEIETVKNDINDMWVEVQELDKGYDLIISLIERIEKLESVIQSLRVRSRIFDINEVGHSARLGQDKI